MKGYISFVLQNAPRLLSNIDRRRQSPTYGCADRNYWHYKIVDFPCAMLQVTCLTLAQLYSLNFEGNIYYQREVIRDLSLGVVDFWSKMQKADGSFDEFFPNEHSFSPTAFSLYAVCMTYKILEIDDSPIVLQARKSARFLLKYGDIGATNQEIAAVAGIYLYYLISGDASVLKGLDGLVRKILKSQSPEGWTQEYQGPDVGYQSIALGYMTDYYRFSQDSRVKDCFNSMIEFLSYFIHPDGSAGGEYGSRDTSYLAPHGFELNAQINPLAKRIAERVFLEGKSKINSALDDRYICHFLLPSYLTSIEHYSTVCSHAKLPCETDFEKYFKESNIFIKSTNKYYFICNLRKGGCFKLFTKGADSLSDSGYIVRRFNVIAISNWIDFSSRITLTNGMLQVEGAFQKMISRVPTTLWHLSLRLISLFFGRRVLPFLKKHFIIRDKPIDVVFKRVIEYGEAGFEVRDKISAKDGKVFELLEADTLAYRYVAPTNYFSDEELKLVSMGKESLGKDLINIGVRKTINLEPISLVKEIVE